MSKQALVISKDDFFKYVVKTFEEQMYKTDHLPYDAMYMHSDGYASLEPDKPMTFVLHGLYLMRFLKEHKAGMMSRLFCENDDNYLQLIPYIFLINENNEVFIYARGEKGDEGRLHGLCSMGLGGHIEEGPTKDLDIISIINQATMRELIEEVDYAGPNISIFKNEEAWTHPADGANRIEVVGFYSESEEVGKMHLAIAAAIKINSKDLGDHEEGVITKGEWVPIANLPAYIEENGVTLEAWSNYLRRIILSRTYAE